MLGLVLDAEFAGKSDHTYPYRPSCSTSDLAVVPPLRGRKLHCSMPFLSAAWANTVAQLLSASSAAL